MGQSAGCFIWGMIVDKMGNQVFVGRGVMDGQTQRCKVCRWGRAQPLVQLDAGGGAAAALSRMKGSGRGAYPAPRQQGPAVAPMHSSRARLLCCSFLFLSFFLESWKSQHVEKKPMELVVSY